MRVLIISEANDAHALAVKLALKTTSHICDILSLSNMPQHQTHSLYISNNQFDWLLHAEEKPYSIVLSQQFDVIWWRRPRKPQLPLQIHPDDFKCVEKENNLFNDSIPLMLDPSAWWINPYGSVRYANSKIYQLKTAPHFNLKIPPTLISNNAKNIKAFLSQYSEVVYKTFYPHNWYEDDSLKCAYTQKVTLGKLPSDKILQMTPGIFQQQLQKKYDIRVTCFGNHLVAVKIPAQDSNPEVDWRAAPKDNLKLEPYALPLDIKLNIQKFMKSLGIVFGCFDFIVTPDDDIYFLEVNQQGQFLWIENLLPEVRMLDIFIQFILSQNINFKWSSRANCIRLSDYSDEVSTMINTENK